MPKLSVVIDARKAREGAADFNASTQSMAAGAKRSIGDVKRLNTEMDGLGKTGRKVKRALVGIFAGVSGAMVLRDATTVIKGFQETMSTLAAVTGVDRLSAQFQELETVARDLGATTKFSAREAGEGLVFLARAGFSSAQAIAALPATLNLAAAGAIELGAAADYASNILSQFNLAAEETVRVADILVTTANSSNTSVTQLADALVYAGSVAGAINHSLEETAAAIGVLGDSGIQASMAGTQMRGMISALLGPTSMANKAIKEMGLSVDELNPATHSMTEIMTKLADANLTAAQAVTIFGRRNAAGAIILSRGVEKLKELTKANVDSKDAAEEAATIMSDNLAGAFRSLRSATEEAYLQIGDAGFTGALRAAVDVTTAAIRILSDMSGKAEDTSVAAQLLAGGIQALTYSTAAFIALKLVEFLVKATRSLMGFTAAAALANSQMAMMGTLAVADKVSRLAFMFSRLKTVLTNHPIFWIATAIGAAVAAFVTLNRVINQADKDIRRLRGTITELKDISSEIENIAALKKFAAATASLHSMTIAYNKEVALLKDRWVEVQETIDRGDKLTLVSNVKDLLPPDVLEEAKQVYKDHLEHLKSLHPDLAKDFQDKYFDAIDIMEMRTFMEKGGGYTERAVKIGTKYVQVNMDAAHVLKLLEARLKSLGVEQEAERERLQEIIDEVRGYSEETGKARAALDKYYQKLADQREVLQASTELERKQIKVRQELRESLEALGPIERAYQTFKLNMLVKLNHLLGENKEKQEAANDALAEWVERLRDEQEQAEETAARLRELAEDRIYGLERDYLQRGFSGKDRFIDDLHEMMHQAGYAMDHIESELDRASEMWDEIELAETMVNLGGQMGVSFSDAIYGMIDDTYNLKQALEVLAQDVSRMFYDAFVTTFIEDQMKEMMRSIFGGEGLQLEQIVQTEQIELMKTAGTIERTTMETTAATTANGLLIAAGVSLYTNMINGAMQAAAILSAAGGGAFAGAGAKGLVFGGGDLVPFGRGGVFDGPTVFQLPRSKRYAVVGEAGEEAAVPLKRMKSGNLGVEMEGKGGHTYNINFHVHGVSDLPAWKRSRKQFTDDLADTIRGTH